MMIIAMVYKTGGDFTRKHVAMLNAQLPKDRVVVCLTDDRDFQLPDVEMLPLMTSLSGWWSKLELFAPWNFNNGDRIVYFDLDTVILKHPEFLYDWRGDFTMLRDLWTPTRPASGVMAWRVNFHTSQLVWNMAQCNPSSHDGAAIGAVVGLPWPTVQDIQPGVCSFKPVPCDQGTWRRELDGSETVVCFHGQPRPWDVAHQIPWLTKHYETLMIDPVEPSDDLARRL